MARLMYKKGLDFLGKYPNASALATNFMRRFREFSGFQVHPIQHHPSDALNKVDIEAEEGWYVGTIEFDVRESFVLVKIADSPGKDWLSTTFEQTIRK